MRELVICLFLLIGLTSCGQPIASESLSVTDPNAPIIPPSSPIVSTPKSTTFVYRLDTAAEKIYYASVDLSSGEMAEHPAVDLIPGSTPVSMAMSSDKKFLFIASEGTNKIDTYELDQVTGEPQWSSTKSAIFTPIKKVFADPQNRFVWTYEGEFPGGRLVSYYLAADGSLTLGASTSISDTGVDLAVDSNGEFLYVLLDSAGVTPYEVDPVNGQAINEGSNFGASATDLILNSSFTHLFGAPSLFGDKGLSYEIDPVTRDISFAGFLNGGQLTPFNAISLNADDDRMYLLSGSNPEALKSFVLSYTPTVITAQSSVSLSSGCNAKAMAHLVSDNYIFTACTDGLGISYSVKVEANGSLTQKSTSVRSGMKVNSMIAVTF